MPRCERTGRAEGTRDLLVEDGMEGKVAKVSLEVRTGEATRPHRAYGEARSPERTCACGVYHAVLNATPVKTPSP